MGRDINEQSMNDLAAAVKQRGAVAAASLVCTHLVTYAGMCCAFSKALRMGRISAGRLKRPRGASSASCRSTNG
jgi:hypothetical protein